MTGGLTSSLLQLMSEELNLLYTNTQFNVAAMAPGGPWLAKAESMHCVLPTTLKTNQQTLTGGQYSIHWLAAAKRRRRKRRSSLLVLS